MVRRWIMVGVLGAGLITSACGRSDDALPSFKHAVRGDRVDTDSFLHALRSSFRTGSTADVTFDVVGGAVLRGKGSVRYAAKTMDSSLQVDDWEVKGAHIGIRTIGGTTYMRVPESRGLWVDLDDGGDGLPGATLADDADPRKSIEKLRGTITQVRFSGTETVGGVKARRFQVVTEPPSQASVAAGGSAGPSHPTVTEYWFDQRDHVIRRHSELAQSSSATFTWADWGKSVNIVRPKKGTVITLKRLQELRKKQQSGPPS